MILSNFTHNITTVGGGNNVHCRENATHNHVKFLKCSFIGNIGHTEDGGLVFGNVIHQMTETVNTIHTTHLIACLKKIKQQQVVLLWVLYIIKHNLAQWAFKLIDNVSIQSSPALLLH